MRLYEQRSGRARSPLRFVRSSGKKRHPGALTSSARGARSPLRLRGVRAKVHKCESPTGRAWPPPLRRFAWPHSAMRNGMVIRPLMGVEPCPHPPMRGRASHGMPYGTESFDPTPTAGMPAELTIAHAPLHSVGPDPPFTFSRAIIRSALRPKESNAPCSRSHKN